MDAVRSLQGITGAIVDPFAAYLLVRGIKTFALRMERQNANAQTVAEFLAGHPNVTAVHYPGLPSHREHEVAKRQMRGFGGVVSFEVRGDLDAASRVVDACAIPHLAVSLGGVETLIEQPAIMSFYELTTEERLEIGIKDNLIRYAVGIEDADDLVADLAQALDRAFATPRRRVAARRPLAFLEENPGHEPRRWPCRSGRRTGNPADARQDHARPESSSSGLPGNVPSIFASAAATVNRPDSPIDLCQQVAAARSGSR